MQSMVARRLCVCVCRAAILAEQFSKTKSLEKSLGNKYFKKGISVDYRRHYPAAVAKDGQVRYLSFLT
jgi:hypothetical protein